MIKVLIIFLFSLNLLAQSDVALARDLIGKGKLQEAEVLLESRMKKHPSDPLVHELLGDICGKRKNWDCAADYYLKVKNLKPLAANSHYKYGGALGMKAQTVNKFRALGMIGNIRGAFEKAIELDHKHLEARWALIELNLQLPAIAGGSISKANQYALELARLSPVDGYLSRARIAEYQEDFPSAEKNYKLAWEKYNSRTGARSLAALYKKMKKPQKAEAVLLALGSD